MTMSCAAGSPNRSGASLRIAGLLHVMNVDSTQPLDLSNMQRGIAISEWYREHAEIAFNLMQGSSNDDARAVWAVLLDFGMPSVNRSDLQQKLRGRKSFQCGYIHVRKVTTGECGRPVEWVDLNPRAITESHTRKVGKF